MSRRYPPRRRCQSCGSDYYAWQELGVCLRCRRSSADDAMALREMVRDARLARRASFGDTVDPSSSPKLPRDDIPY